MTTSALSARAQIHSPRRTSGHAPGLVPVLAAPLIDPGAGRIALDLPEGLTLAEIVRQALPGLPPADLALVRLSLVTPAGAEAIDPALWYRVRPRAGVRVVIRLLPGKNALRSILMIVVSVAAIALGGMLAPALAGATGIGLGVANGLITAGLTMVGQMLVNALVPLPQPPSPQERQTRYTIGAPRNESRPDRPVPMPMGRLRYAPPYAAASYTEIVGNDQYVRALFCFGDGPLHLSAFQIGDTGLENYKDVEIEVREGWPGDAPVTLYPRQVLEEAANAELTRPLPRDAYGEVIKNQPAEEAPVQRFTAFDTWACSMVTKDVVQFAFAEPRDRFLADPCVQQARRRFREGPEKDTIESQEGREERNCSKRIAREVGLRPDLANRGDDHRGKQEGQHAGHDRVREHGQKHVDCHVSDENRDQREIRIAPEVEGARRAPVAGRGCRLKPQTAQAEDGNVAPREQGRLRDAESDPEPDQHVVHEIPLFGINRSAA